MGHHVLVVGAGGHAKVVIDSLRAAQHLVSGVFDDGPGRTGTTFRGVRVCGPVAALVAHARSNGQRHFVVAIGDNAIRERIGRELAAAGLVALPVVHPSAVVGAGVELGAGSVILPGACVNADAKIGNYAIVNSGAIVEHDCILGDAAHVAQGAVIGGGARVGARAWLGLGCRVASGVQIGNGARIAVGEIVTADIADVSGSATTRP